MNVDTVMPPQYGAANLAADLYCAEKFRGEAPLTPEHARVWRAYFDGFQDCEALR